MLIAAIQRTKAVLPNWSVNADKTMGHALGILMAHGCALRPSDSGAGYLRR